MVKINRFLKTQVKRLLLAVFLAGTFSVILHAAAGLDLKVRRTTDPCSGNGPTVEFAIINNTGAAVSGPITIVMWFDNAGTYNVNSPQVQGNYTSAYPSTSGWNQAGSAGSLSSSAFGCAIEHATTQISINFTPQNPISAGGWMAARMQIYLNGWPSPFDPGCDDYSLPPTTFSDYSHVAIYRAGVLETEWLAPGGVLDPDTGRVPCSVPTATPTSTTVGIYNCAQDSSNARDCEFVPVINSTPTFTRTYTRTPTRTATPTFTSTRTPTPTYTQTPSPTPTYTRTPTPTSTLTRTPTQSPTPTYTVTATPTFTYTRTQTPSPTATPTHTPTYTATNTSTFTSTRTATPTPTDTRTITMTRTPTDTVSSNTPTNTPTSTPTYTVTPTYTATNTETSTYTATSTRTVTETRTQTSTSTSTRTPTPTFTATPTVTETNQYTPTPTYTYTNTRTFTPTFTATPTSTETRTPTATFTSTLTRTNTPTATPTSTETVTTSPTDTPTFTRTVTDTPTYTATPTETSTFTPTSTFSFTSTRTATPTITETSIPFPFIITISAYNEAGELVKIIASERVTTMMTQALLEVPGNTTASIVGTDNVLNILVPGVETNATLGTGGSMFTWDITNQQSQFVDPGKYYIKIEETDAYGHTNVIIKDIQVVRLEQYIELKVFNAAGELVRTIRETNKPVPAFADLSSMGDIIVIENNGSPVNVKYGTSLGEFLLWDGKTSDGKVVASGNYELQLSVKTELGSITHASKTVVVLREGKTYLEDLQAWPNPYTKDSGTAGMTFNWTVFTAGETGSAYIRIYNVAGEIVREIRTKLETGSAFWDLRNGAGEHVGRGFYVVVITTKNADGYPDSKTVKIAVISYE